jgi:hypothetical protein
MTFLISQRFSGGMAIPGVTAAVGWKSPGETTIGAADRVATGIKNSAGRTLDMIAHEQSIDVRNPSSREESSSLAPLFDLGGVKPFAFYRPPHKIAADVLPQTLQSPHHVQLPVGEVLQEAVTDQPHYVLPVIVAFVRDFFLQDGADRNHGSKGIPEDQKLQKKFAA